MLYLGYFIFSFVIVYLFYLVTVILQKKKYDKFKNMNQVLFFTRKYKLKKLDMKKFLNEISIINSVMIALTFTVVVGIENLIIKLLIGFVIIITLVLIVYSLYGKILKRRDKNV